MAFPRLEPMKFNDPSRPVWAKLASALLGVLALVPLMADLPGLRLSPQDKMNMNGWKLYSPLPDPVGFGGMFAGVLDGRLVTGGGAQWDKPIWRQGHKHFNDRVFTLSAPLAGWVVSPTPLPVKSGYFASASAPDAIYLAGGIDTAGCVSTAYELKANDGGLVYRRLPDLPHPLGYAVAAIAGGRLWVMGGAREPASTAASSEVWSLGLSAPSGSEGWRREEDIPGPGVIVAAAASDGNEVYLIGGMAFDSTGKFEPSKRAYSLNVMDRKWRRLPDLPEPRVGAASPCPVLAGNRIFVVSGYSEVFPGAPRDHPGFNRQTLYFDIGRQTWERGPVLPAAPVPDRDAAGDPGPAPMIGAPCVVWQGSVVVVSGEVRAAVRSPAVVAWPALNLDSFPAPAVAPRTVHGTP